MQFKKIFRFFGLGTAVDADLGAPAPAMVIPASVLPVSLAASLREGVMAGEGIAAAIRKVCGYSVLHCDIKADSLQETGREARTAPVKVVTPSLEDTLRRRFVGWFSVGPAGSIAVPDADAPVTPAKKPSFAFRRRKAQPATPPPIFSFFLSLLRGEPLASNQPVGKFWGPKSGSARRRLARGIPPTDAQLLKWDCAATAKYAAQLLQMGVLVGDAKDLWDVQMNEVEEVRRHMHLRFVTYLLDTGKIEKLRAAVTWGEVHSGRRGPWAFGHIPHEWMQVWYALVLLDRAVIGGKEGTYY
ncbi:hypothetical protein EDC01DRAFT_635183 [Geopyxis carbonaria]|nr:hypothetical protein EDC01DRAFT_635183 [Geopyxis carbonaria]